MDTRAYRLARRSDIPVFEVDLPVNIARKKAAVQRAIGGVPASVHLVPLDFERDDLIGALTGHGYRPDARTFFIWEGVTQYLTEDAVRATLGALQAAPAGSRLVFTYVRKDFIDGVNMYDAAILYKRFRQRQQVWRFGLDPDAGFGIRGRIRLAARRAGGARLFPAQLHRADRPRSDRVAARVVGIRGEAVVPPI